MSKKSTKSFWMWISIKITGCCCQLLLNFSAKLQFELPSYSFSKFIFKNLIQHHVQHDLRFILRYIYCSICVPFRPKLSGLSFWALFIEANVNIGDYHWFSYSLISMTPNYYFDTWAIIWHGIVCWFMFFPRFYQFLFVAIIKLFCTDMKIKTKTI